jgi:type I protein arginine methyltransferase
MYSIGSYAKMIADAPRIEAYAAALKAAVKPGSVVLDLGTGPGLFALIACHLGARRVYAVEPDNVIQLGREIAAANAFADRIEFIQAFSEKVSLPEKVDVIVSDLRGVLPFFDRNILTIRDARTRFLSSNGTLIARSDTLWAALADASSWYDELIAPWSENKFGCDLRVARGLATNSWIKARIQPEQLIAEAHCWATLDYFKVESPDVRANMTWSIARAGTVHGLYVWFDSELAEGISFSNKPGDPELIYGGAFFPLTRPVEIVSGDEVKVTIRADLVSDDYVWGWNTRISSGGTPDKLKADFRQSTFLGLPLSPAQLRKRAAHYRPSLTERGQIKRFVLSRMDGQTPLEQIASELEQHFPGQFGNAGDALNLVVEVSARYSA